MKLFLNSEKVFAPAIPSVLGISFALLLFAIFKEEDTFIYVALVLLLLAIVRFGPLLLITNTIQAILKAAGAFLVKFILSVLYLALISPYALLVRLFSGALRRKFHEQNLNSNYHNVDYSYTKEYFERPW